MKLFSKIKNYFDKKDEYSCYLKERNSIIKEHEDVLEQLGDIPKRSDNVAVMIDSFEELLEVAEQNELPIYYNLEEKSSIFLVMLEKEILIFTFRMNDSVICETERTICRACANVLGNVSEAMCDGTIEELEDTLIFHIDENGLHLDDKASVSENVEMILHNDEDFSKTMYIKKLKLQNDNVHEEKEFENFDIRLAGYVKVGNKKKDLNQCTLIELLNTYFGIKIVINDSLDYNVTMGVVQNIIAPNLKKDLTFIDEIIEQNKDMSDDELLALDFVHLDKLTNLINEVPWSRYGKKYLSVPGSMIDHYNSDLEERKLIYRKLLGVPEQVSFFRIGAKDDNGKEATWYSPLAFEKIVLRNDDKANIADTSYYLGRVGTKVQRMLWSLSKYIFFDLKDNKSLSLFLNENLIDKFYTPYTENKNVFNYLYDYLKYVYFYAETMCHLKVLYDRKGGIKKWSTSNYSLDEGYVEVNEFSSELLNSMRGKILNSYMCIETDDEFLDYRKYLRKSLADLYIEFLKKNHKTSEYKDFYEFVLKVYPEHSDLLKK